MATANFANPGDIPGLLDTKGGVMLAYGILWKTWTDNREQVGAAAQDAKSLLAGELTDDERRRGINMALDVLSAN